MADHTKETRVRPKRPMKVEMMPTKRSLRWVEWMAYQPPLVLWVQPRELWLTHRDGEDIDAFYRRSQQFQWTRHLYRRVQWVRVHVTWRAA